MEAMRILLVKGICQEQPVTNACISKLYRLITTLPFFKFNVTINLKRLNYQHAVQVIQDIVPT